MRKLFNSKHERVYKRCTLVIIVPGRKREVSIIRAPHGRAFDDVTLTKILHAQADRLEKMLPAYEFRFVSVGNLQFNFVGELKPDAMDSTPNALPAQPGIAAQS